MTKILLTGYEPFGEYDTNPSAQLAADLDGITTDELTVIGKVLPVVFDEARPSVTKAIETHQPDTVLSTGLMPGRSAVTVERIGINVRDYDGVPDNDAQVPIDSPVNVDGPAAYFATLPIRSLVSAGKEVGVPTRISNSAGTHLCNNILYSTRHHVEENNLAIRSGFVHVPFTHAQVARRDNIEPSMSYDAMQRAVRAMLDVLADD